MQVQKVKCRFLTYASVTLTVLVCASLAAWHWNKVFLLVCIVIRCPNNHAGSVYHFLPSFLSTLVYQVSRLVGASRFSRIGLIASLLGCLLVVTCDVFNIWISYDVWVERGMPGWGCLKAGFGV